MAWYRCGGGSQKEITLYEVGTSTTQAYSTITNALSAIVNTLNGSYAGYGNGFSIESKGKFTKLKCKSGNDGGDLYIYGLNKGSDGLYSTEQATQLAYKRLPSANTEFEEIDISEYDAIFVTVLSIYQGVVRGLSWLKLYN